MPTTGRQQWRCFSEVTQASFQFRLFIHTSSSMPWLSITVQESWDAAQQGGSECGSEALEPTPALRTHQSEWPVTYFSQAGSCIKPIFLSILATEGHGGGDSQALQYALCAKPTQRASNKSERQNILDQELLANYFVLHSIVLGTLCLQQCHISQ